MIKTKYEISLETLKALVLNDQYLPDVPFALCLTDEARQYLLDITKSQPVTAVAEEKRCVACGLIKIDPTTDLCGFCKPKKEEQKGCSGGTCVACQCPCNCHQKEEYHQTTGMAYSINRAEPDSPQEKCDHKGKIAYSDWTTFCWACREFVSEYYTKSEIDDLLSNACARMDLHDGRINGLAEISEGRGKVIDEMKSEEKEWRKALLEFLTIPNIGFTKCELISKLELEKKFADLKSRFL